MEKDLFNALDKALQQADQNNYDPNNPATDTAIQDAIINAKLPTVVGYSVHLTSDKSQSGEAIEIDLQLHQDLTQVAFSVNPTFLPGKHAAGQRYRRQPLTGDGVGVQVGPGTAVSNLTAT
jgi:hypothetical protein